MITRLPSVQSSFDLVWSGDSAFVQLPDIKDNATPAEIEQCRKLSEEHTARWKVARETGDYKPLAVEGASAPSVFTFGQLTHDQTATLNALAKSRTLGDSEIFSLAFHAALQSVTNLGDAKIERNVFHPRLGPIVSSKFFVDAGVPPAVSLQITNELGELVIERMASLGKG